MQIYQDWARKEDALHLLGKDDFDPIDAETYQSEGIPMFAIALSESRSMISRVSVVQLRWLESLFGQATWYASAVPLAEMITE